MLKTKDGLDLVTHNWKVSEPKALLVLTHGYNDHANRFAHVGKVLNDAGYALYAYDLRGHGRSAGPRGHAPDFDCFLDDLGRVIAEARRDHPDRKLFVYGHSMGGNITLNYALRRPDGLSGVIATSPWLKLAFEPNPFLVAFARLIARVVPTFAQKSTLDVTQISRDSAVVEAYRTDPLLHGLITARLLTEIAANGLDALEHAGLLKLPLLLVHGGADKITSAAATQLFFERAASADKTFKLYDGMRHETHNEIGKEDVFADVVGWLDRHV